MLCMLLGQAVENLLDKMIMFCATAQLFYVCLLIRLLSAISQHQLGAKSLNPHTQKIISCKFVLNSNNIMKTV